jgi:hypothetical protein
MPLPAHLHTVLAGFIVLLGLTCSTAAQAAQPSEFNRIYQSYLSAVESGNKKQVLTLAEESFTLGEREFGGAHENVTALRYNLALAQSKMHLGDQAHEHLEMVKAAYANTHGNLSLPVFEVVLEQMHNLKKFPREFKLKRPHRAKALALIEEAETFLDDASLSVDALLDARYHYALTLATLGVDINIFRKTLNILKDTRSDIVAKHGENNISAIELGFLLGKYYHSMDKDSKAIKYMLNVLAVIGDNSQTSHPYQLAAHAQLVQLLEKKGKSEEATQHCIAIGKMTPWSTDTDPIPLYREAPSFPANMARLGKKDSVIIEFLISESGFVIEPKVLDAKHDEFAKIALKAVSNFRYAPKVVDNQTVVSEPKRIQMDFNL